MILLAVSPISELRGGIPLGIALGYHPLIVFTVSVACNILIYFPIRWLLDFVGDRIVKLSFVDKARERCRRIISRYGIFGLALFVGIPLPFTGVYTATLASWSLGYNYREAILPIICGVFMAGVVVTVMTLGIWEILFWR